MEHTFRSSMFGFNKEDVAKFIYQQNKAFEKKMAEKNAELERTSIALAQAEEKYASHVANAEIAEKFKPLFAAFQDKSGDLLCAVDREKDDLDAMAAGFQSLAERCEKLTAFREKAKKFDSLAAALSGIFGNGATEEKDLPLEECDGEVISPVSSAKVHWEERRKAVEELVSICEEISVLLSDFSI